VLIPVLAATTATVAASTSVAQTVDLPTHYLVPSGQDLQLVPNQNEQLDRRFFEQIQDFSFGHRLRQVASGVGRFEIRFDGDEDWRLRHCTASLISDEYILTAHHCVTTTSPPFAPLPLSGARLRLGFLSDADPGVVWQIDPSPVANNFSPVPDLDYAVLRIISDDRLGPPTARFKPVQLFPFDPEPGKELFIVHHPEGQNQRLTARECRVVELAATDTAVANTIPHRCDTRGGSSGAPVFSEAFDVVVGLHHAGINRIQTNFAKQLTAIAEHSDIVASLALSERPLTQAEVEDQREQAIDQAVAAATETLEQLVDRFVNRQGVTAQDIRDTIRISENRFEELTQSFGNDPKVRFGRASVLNRVADAQLVLGDTLAAAAAISDSISTYRELIKDVGPDIAALIDLSVALDVLGDIKTQLNDTIGALEAYDEALAITRRLASQNPDDPEYRRDVSISLTKIGDVQAGNGNLSEAAELYADALQIALQLSDLDRPNELFKRDMAIALDRVAQIKALQGDLSGALTDYKSILAINSDIVDSNPGDTEKLFDLATALERVGTTQFKLDRYDDALVSLQKSEDILIGLVDSDPSNVEFLRGSFVQIVNIGDIHRDQTRHAEASSKYREAVRISSVLVDVDPQNSEYQRDQSVALNRLGNVRVAQGQYSDAIKNFQESLDIARQLSVDNPASFAFQFDISVVLSHMGEAMRLLGNRQAAADALQESQSIAETLAELEPSNQTWLSQLEYVNYELGLVQRKN